MPTSLESEKRRRNEAGVGVVSSVRIPDGAAVRRWNNVFGWSFLGSHRRKTARRASSSSEGRVASAERNDVTRGVRHRSSRRTAAGEKTILYTTTHEKLVIERRRLLNDDENRKMRVLVNVSISDFGFDKIGDVLAISQENVPVQKSKKESLSRMKRR